MNCLQNLSIYRKNTAILFAFTPKKKKYFLRFFFFSIRVSHDKSNNHRVGSNFFSLFESEDVSFLNPKKALEEN